MQDLLRRQTNSQTNDKSNKGAKLKVLFEGEKKTKRKRKLEEKWNEWKMKFAMERHGMLQHAD